jgi:hypothetical protein
MPLTDTEQEDAKLRAAGFEPDASPADALARLRELRGAPGVAPGAIARALGALATPGAAAMLADMEAAASGAARREVRRALFRLSQRGIAPPAAGSGRERPAAPPPPLPPGPPCSLPLTPTARA